MRVFRGFRELEVEEINHRYVSGRGFFGPGTYLSLGIDDAWGYTNGANGPKIVLEYELNARLIELSNEDILNLSLIDPDRDALNLSDRISKLLNNRNPRELGGQLAAMGYEGLWLKGTVDGGEQILLFPEQEAHLVPLKIFIKVWCSSIAREERLTESLQKEGIECHTTSGSEVIFSLAYEDRSKIRQLLWG